MTANMSTTSHPAATRIRMPFPPAEVKIDPLSGL
jgi:hypothetical protein